MEMSMKLSEDFTKKLGFSEEGEEIRKLERSWSKLEDSVEFDEEKEAGEEEEFSFACVNAEGSRDLLFDQNDGVSETDDEEINRPHLRKVFVESHIPTEKSPDDMKSMAVEAILLLQEKINDDDEETVKMQLLVPSKVVLRLREDVLGDRGSVSARNPPPARSDHSGFTLPPFVSSVPEYASVDFDQRRDTGESSLGMVSSDRFYGYESSFPISSHFEARDHGLVSVGSILIWRVSFANYNKELGFFFITLFQMV
ncbi:hypothetical protein IGI04_034950 [Brassica rapa subsp. trilocularis]|uniref:Protein TSSC4 n=1 Tax=Brassica rapa subsp. trilocularis TaxID=1813537 RepID=A0ABQ7LC60_BRACM|nr:hypothetical protein IGI04_034950 [Brassica rapa subsp. trilocularis]